MNKLSKAVDTAKYAKNKIGEILEKIAEDGYTEEHCSELEGVQGDLDNIYIELEKDLAELETKIAVEICYDESGNVLWYERYMFNRIHGKGESFIKDSKNYVVISGKITFTDNGAALIEHVVEERK